MKLRVSKSAGLALGVSMVAMANPSVSAAWTTSGSNIYYTTGNVGVGTSTPVSPLQVFGGNGSPSLTSDAGQVSNMTSNTSVQLAMGASSSSPNPFWMQTKQSVNSGAAFPLAINPLGGNVGVGTLTPVTTFQVFGTNGAPSLSSDATQVANITSNSSVQLSMGASASSPNPFWLQTKQSTNSGVAFPLALNPAGGNVGIGTTAPTATLEVNGDTIGTGSLEVDGELISNTGMLAASGVVNFAGYDFWENTTAGLGMYRVSENVLGFVSNSVERIRVTSTGNVGIGTTAPSHILHIAGVGRSTAASWATTSDARLKNVEGDSQKGTAELLQLPVVNYTYKSKNPYSLPSNQKFVGTLAQEAEKVFPEAVTKDNKGYLVLNTDPIFWAMVKSTQETHAKLVAADAKLEQLKSENEMLKSYLCAKDLSAPFCH